MLLGADWPLSAPEEVLRWPWGITSAFDAARLVHALQHLHTAGRLLPALRGGATSLPAAGLAEPGAVVERCRAVGRAAGAEAEELEADAIEDAAEVDVELVVCARHYLGGSHIFLGGGGGEDEAAFQVCAARKRMRGRHFEATQAEAKVGACCVFRGRCGVARGRGRIPYFYMIRFTIS